jgi:hypothetical protein
MSKPKLKDQDVGTNLYEESLRKNPFPYDFSDPHARQKDILRRRLAGIDGHLKAVSDRLKVSKAGSYQHQEREAERRDLMTWRRIAENELAALEAPLDREQIERGERRLKILNAMEAEQRELARHSIELLEQQGDYRQARIERMELLKLREHLARTLH